MTLNEISVEKRKPHPFINWNKLKADDTETFRSKMSENLDKISIPFYSLLHGDQCCNDSCHMAEIQSYFWNIVHAVQSSESVLPRTNPALYKPYWSNTINELKRKSIVCTNE